MIVYNITIKIKQEIKVDWIQWQKKEHIPEILATGLFSEFKFFHLLDHNQEDGITYIIQYFASSHEDYQRYIKEFAPMFRQKAFAKWGDSFITFRTVMELVQ